VRLTREILAVGLAFQHQKNGIPAAKRDPNHLLNRYLPYDKKNPPVIKLGWKILLNEHKKQQVQTAVFSPLNSGILRPCLITKG
jgi:hypothetical protein